jgi:hypothetical protein
MKAEAFGVQLPKLNINEYLIKRANGLQNRHIRIVDLRGLEVQLAYLLLIILNSFWQVELQVLRYCTSLSL